MRTQLLIGGAMIAATAVLAWIGMAKAAPPDAGAYQALTTPIIACDTKEQMTQVVDAIKGGTLQAKMTELHAQTDQFNEPVCVYSPLPPVAFGESEHLGQIKDHDHTIDAWIVHVGNSRTEFYVLWGEEVKESSI